MGELGVTPGEVVVECGFCGLKNGLREVVEKSGRGINRGIESGASEVGGGG